jgi:hypothetical protein
MPYPVAMRIRVLAEYLTDVFPIWLLVAVTSPPLSSYSTSGSCRHGISPLRHRIRGSCQAHSWHLAVLNRHGSSCFNTCQVRTIQLGHEYWSSASLSTVPCAPDILKLGLIPVRTMPRNSGADATQLARLQPKAVARTLAAWIHSICSL